LVFTNKKVYTLIKLVCTNRVVYGNYYNYLVKLFLH
jgi:hypothetical protein